MLVDEHARDDFSEEIHSRISIGAFMSNQKSEKPSISQNSNQENSFTMENGKQPEKNYIYQYESNDISVNIGPDSASIEMGDKGKRAELFNNSQGSLEVNRQKNLVGASIEFSNGKLGGSFTAQVESVAGSYTTPKVCIGDDSVRGKITGELGFGYKFELGIGKNTDRSRGASISVSAGPYPFFGKFEAGIITQKNDPDCGSKNSHAQTDQREAYNYAKRLGLENLSINEFFSTLESNGLVDSYVRNHPDAQINSINGYRGEIGGVAVEVGQIQRFSNTPAQSLFSDLMLCLPYASDTQDLPFSQNQLRQVLAELTEIVLMDQTNPFFSLHFSEDGRLYPIIHPAYQNTLVGDVIGMLDYYMKGYLNGGVYPEEFIRNWHQTENMDRDYLFNHVIDLRQYAREHSLDYTSLRELMYQRGLSDAHENNSEDQTNYRSRFQTSFRIIAKQKDVQAEENFLLGDPDFDVKYSIDLMPHYQEYIDDYVAKNGAQPDEYQRLQHAYEYMANEIKTNMPKLPFTQGYFNLLEVISFFCYILHSLKSRGQMPDLSQPVDREIYAFPPSLPPYPVRHYQFFPVKITIGDLITTLSSSEKTQINALIKEAFIQSSKPLWENIKLLFLPAISKNLINQIPGNENVLDEGLLQAVGTVTVMRLKQFVAEYKVIQEKKIELLESLSDSQNKLSTLTDDQINQLLLTLTSDGDDGFFDSDREQLKAFIIILQKNYLEKEKVLVVKMLDNVRQKIEEILEIKSKAYLDFLSYVDSLPGNVDKPTTKRDAENQYKIERDKIIALREILLAVIKQSEDEVIEPLILQIENEYRELARAYWLDKVENLKLMEKNLLEIYKEHAIGLKNEFLDSLSPDLLIFENDEMPISTLDIGDRSFLQAEGRDDKVIGGCGVDLSQVYLKPLKLESQTYQSIKHELDNLPTETLERIEIKNTPHYAFKLNLIDHLSSEVFHYQFFVNPLQPITATQTEEKFVTDMLEDHNANPKQGVDFNASLDRKGQTVLHYGSLLANESQSKQLFNRSTLNASCSIFDENGYNAFHTAIVANNYPVFERLLNLQPQFANQLTQKRYSPLMLACLHGNVAMVSRLIEVGADPNVTLMDGSSALMLAIQNGQVEAAIRLLSDSPIVNVNLKLVHGQTPLHEALEINQPNVVAALVAEGAKLSARRHQDGFTPFHCAAFCGREEQVRLLLDRRPGLLNIQIESGETALHLAAKQGCLQVVETLVRYGIDVDFLDSQGNSALLIAIREGFKSIVEILLPLSHLTQKNKAGESALSLAAKLSDFVLCDILIARGADLAQHEIDQSQINGMPLSFYLIVRGEYQRYKQYVNQGFINPNQKYQEKSARQIAALHGQPKLHHFLSMPSQLKKKPHRSIAIYEAVLVDSVRKLKANLREGDICRKVGGEKGEKLPLLHLAAKYASTACLNYLVENMDVEMLKRLKHAEHPLAFAVESCRTDVVDTVLRLVRDINEPLNRRGDTVMHIAVESGNLLLVEHLHARGADVNKVNNLGKTAWHASIFSDDHKMIKLLFRLNQGEVIPPDLYAYALELDAAACIKQLNKHVGQTTISQRQLFELCRSAIQQKEFDLLSKLMVHGYPEVKREGHSLLEFSVIHDDPVSFSLLLSKAPNRPLDEVFLLAINNKSFQIISYLHTINGTAIKESIQIGIVRRHRWGEWLVLAALNDQQGLLEKEQAIIEAMIMGEIKAFKALIADLPVNRYYFSWKGDRLPLLHIAVIKDCTWAVKYLKDRHVDPLLLDSKGYGIAHKIKPKKQFLIEWLQILNKYFPDELPEILSQVSQYNISLLDHLFGYGFREALPDLLMNKLSTDILDKKQRSLLHKAVEFNNLELMQMALDRGLPVDSKDKEGLTPLMLASVRGYERFARMLLHAGADPNKKDKIQRTALHYAALSGSVATALTLLSVTKNIDVVDREGWTALLIAASEGNVVLMRHLLTYQPNLEHCNRKGLSALHLAAMLGKIDCLFLLVYSGHAIDFPQQRTDKPHKSTGMTPFHYSAKFKQKESILALLTLGASINQEDESGYSFIHHAVTANEPILDEIVLNLLKLDDEAFQAELLISIAMGENLSLLRRFLSLGISLDVTNKRGNTPLHAALLNRQYNMVSSLLNYGANPLLSNILGEQAIHCAARIGELSFIRELAKEQYGVDFNAATLKGETPLHLAVKNGHDGCVIELLRLGKGQENLMSYDGSNYTPIHHALKNNNWEIAETLLLHLSHDEMEALLTNPSFINLPTLEAYKGKLQQIQSALLEKEEKGQLSIVPTIQFNNNYALHLLCEQIQVLQKQGFDISQGLNSLQISQFSPSSQATALLFIEKTVHMMESLNLSGCHILDDDALKRILNHADFERLKKIDLSDCPLLTLASWETITDCSALTTLNLKGCTQLFTNRKIATIKPLTNLVYLSLSGIEGELPECIINSIKTSGIIKGFDGRPHVYAAYFKELMSLYKSQSYQDVIAALTLPIFQYPDEGENYYWRGLCLYKLGCYADALEDFHLVIELQPNNGLNYHWRGACLYELGRYTEALEDFHFAIELQPKNRMNHHRRGTCLYKLGRYTEALEDFHLAIELQPNNRLNHHWRGTCLYELGRYAEALEDFELAVKLQPTNRSNHYWRGVCLYELGRYTEALEDFHLAIKLQPNNWSSHQWRGKCLYQLGRYTKALDDLNLAIELQPNNRLNHYWHDLCLSKLDRNLEALDDLNVAIKLQPNNWLNHYRRGKCLYKLLGRSTKALEDFNLAVELQPNNGSSHYWRGVCLYQLDRYSEALDALNLAIKLQPNNWLSHYRRGLCLYKFGRYTDALEDFNLAVELQPNNGSNHYNRAQCLYKLGRCTEALHDLNLAIELQPNNRLYRYWRGSCFYKLGRYTAALDDLNLAIKLMPNIWLSHQWRGKCLYKLGCYTDAQEDFHLAIKLQPNNNSNHYWRGRCYFELDDYENALTDFICVTELEKNKPESKTYLWKGKTLYSMGDYTNACTTLTLAIDLEANDKIFTSPIKTLSGIRGVSHFWRAKTYFELEDFAAAYNDLMEAFSLFFQLDRPIPTVLYESISHLLISCIENYTLVSQKVSCNLPTRLTELSGQIQKFIDENPLFESECQRLLKELDRSALKQEIDSLIKEGKQAYKDRQYLKAISLFEKSNQFLKGYSEKYLEDMSKLVSQNHFSMACCYKGAAVKEKKNIFRTSDAYMDQCHQNAVSHFKISNEVLPNQKAQTELNKYKQTKYAEFIKRENDVFVESSTESFIENQNLITVGFFGEAQNNFIPEITLVSETEITPDIQITGLDFQPVEKDGHCLFTAVSLYLRQGETVSELRRIVRAHIEENIDSFKPFINLAQNQTLEEYLDALSDSNQDAEEVEVVALMHLLDRPIIILGHEGNVLNRENLHRPGEPIFIFYNGHNHYDTFTLTGELTAEEIRGQLLEKQSHIQLLKS